MQYLNFNLFHFSVNDLTILIEQADIMTCNPTKKVLTRVLKCLCYCHFREKHVN